MLSTDRYCSNCGGDLTCYACGGSGKMRKEVFPKIYLGTYCCDRRLKPQFQWPEDETCSSCYGTGRTFFPVCKGF